MSKPQTTVTLTHLKLITHHHLATFAIGSILSPHEYPGHMTEYKDKGMKKTCRVFSSAWLSVILVLMCCSQSVRGLLVSTIHGTMHRNSHIPTPTRTLVDSQRSLCQTRLWRNRNRIGKGVVLELHESSRSSRSDANDSKQPTSMNMKMSTNDSDNETDNESEESKEDEPLTTLSGGSNLMFAMARRMLVWDDESYNANLINDASSSNNSNNNNNNDNNSNNNSNNINAGGNTISQSSSSPQRRVILPRWHPTDGIADANPYFRQKSPSMNNRGYANLITRNSRKRGKQSLWRHAYRLYDSMKQKELKQIQELEPSSASSSAGTVGPSPAATPPRLVVYRSNVHFEGALVACAKLGLWREALGIYKDVMEKQQQQQQQQKQHQNKNSNEESNMTTRGGGGRAPIFVTDNMILSIVSACIRGAKNRTTQPSKLRNLPFPLSQQREPLDAARSILLSLHDTHGIPLVARHVNPLAAAYQYLMLHNEATDLLSHLPDRITPAPDMEEYTQPTFTIQDVNAKDVASYHILIQGAIVQGDWETAIHNLKDMTDVKLYPTQRNLNVWSETAHKRERRGGRGKPTWRKERERVLVQGTLQGHKFNNKGGQEGKLDGGGGGEGCVNTSSEEGNEQGKNEETQEFFEEQ